MQRHLPLLAAGLLAVVLCAPMRANAQAPASERYPDYRLPHGYVGIDFSGANRNATAFTYQHLFAITRRSAFTARVGVFGFGNTDGNLFGEGNAQLDLLAGVGVLSSTDNPHNLEIEGTFNRYLRWTDDGINRFQNRFTATAGYRLQPFRAGRGFSLRMGAGMMFYQNYDTGTAVDGSEPVLDNTAVYPTGYLGMGYAF
jgi:hypothetical protein